MDTIGRSSDASRENLTNPEVPASSSSGPSVESCRCLSQGIDSLDLSLYVEWDANWACLSEALQQGKADAAGTDGIEFGDGSCLILPSGKPPNFRWHLQWPEFHLYLAKSRTP